jgi:serine/threonine protein kinase
MQMDGSDPHSTFLGDGSHSDDSPWEIIAERIDQLAAAWDKAQENDEAPPSLAMFTQDLGDATAYSVLVELAKYDLERRWQSGYSPQKAEWYARELPVLGPIENLPVDLIYEELQARMQLGEKITRREIEQRFPDKVDALSELLGGMAVTGSPTCTYFADTVKSEVNTDVKPVSSPASPFAHLKAGDKIDDFELVAPLGSGAFASVFLARQVSMERLVALKISRQVGSEPQTLAQLDHPNIVRVYDLRSSTEGDARLLYMEVVSGGTLLDAIRKIRPTRQGSFTGQQLLDAIDERLMAVGAERPTGSATRHWLSAADWHEVVCWLGAKLADGLHYAHTRGVLHRDIKPANVLLTAEGIPKLADFNVSYNGGRADENPQDAFGGSLAYMSPEQLEACHPLLGGSPQLVREPSDAYALGVLLWELLAGRRPFSDEKTAGGTLVRLQRMVNARCQTDLRVLADDLPDECPDSLREVLTKAIQPEKEDRYETAAAMSRALRMCLHPRCWQLMQGKRSWLSHAVVAHPVWAVVLAGLIPNLFIAAFNFVYNHRRMVDTPALEQRFWEVQGWINAGAFSLGIVIGIKLARDVLRLLNSDDPLQTQRGTRKMLLFGGSISMLLLAIWFVSGLAFPIAIDWNRPEERELGFFVHFFLSLALCGFAATAYPYFVITLLAVRHLVPELIRNGTIPGPRMSDIRSVIRVNRYHLALSGLVPMLGLLLAVVFGNSEDWVLTVVSGMGMLGFGATLWLERSIDADLAALSHLAIEDNPRALRGEAP